MKYCRGSGVSVSMLGLRVSDFRTSHWAYCLRAFLVISTISFHAIRLAVEDIQVYKLPTLTTLGLCFEPRAMKPESPMNPKPQDDLQICSDRKVSKSVRALTLNPKPVF